MTNDTHPVPLPGMRRLPFDSEHGKPAYIQTGGALEMYGDAIEEGLLAAGEHDATHALELLSYDDVSVNELRIAVRYLAGAIQDVAQVARLRADRIPRSEPADAAQQALGRALSATLRLRP